MMTRTRKRENGKVESEQVCVRAREGVRVFQRPCIAAARRRHPLGVAQRKLKYANNRS